MHIINSEKAIFNVKRQRLNIANSKTTTLDV